VKKDRAAARETKTLVAVQKGRRMTLAAKKIWELA